ncbi:hypothetical protein EZS27_043217, partial [termite gut metagenome]
GEAFLFDTPVTNAQTETLVTWLADSLKASVSTFIPNHWHEDCLGGLQYLHSTGIKSYANQLTIELARKHNKPVPQNGFVDSLRLDLNGLETICYFLGGGHSADNIVVWIPSEKTLFGGCMVKDIYAKGLGNLSDAKVEEWPETIQKVTELSLCVLLIISFTIIKWIFRKNNKNPEIKNFRIFCLPLYY